MAKFAKVGYGSQGQGLGTTTDGYTYVVNDNVRTGDRLQVIATSRNGKKFPTTAVPLHTYKETSVKGKLAKQEVEQKTGSEATKAYTGRELGVEGGSRVSKTSATGKKMQSEYTQQTRAASMAMYKQQNPNAEFTKNAQETFDSYSKPFMNKD